MKCLQRWVFSRCLKISLMKEKVLCREVICSTLRTKANVCSPAFCGLQLLPSAGSCMIEPLQKMVINVITKLNQKMKPSQMESQCCPLTSTWPHLRCDVGLEEGECWNKTVSVLTVSCTIIMVHKDTSSSYRLVNCIGLWSCLV